MKKVSIISTVFNGEKHFDKAIPSVLSQTHENFEYIIVDDGSNDNTLEKLKELASKDSRIKVFSPGRLGRVQSLNFALSKCTSNYIFQQDFDDISYPCRIEKQLQVLHGNDDIKVVGSYYKVVDLIKNEEFVRTPPVDNKEIQKAFCKFIPIAHTMAAFKKDFIDSVGGYPELEDIEDLMLWICVAEAGGKFHNIPECLGVHFIYHDSYWSANFKRNIRHVSLAKVQRAAIRRLGFPFYKNIYVIGRIFYSYLPVRISNLIRSRLGAG